MTLEEIAECNDFQRCVDEIAALSQEDLLDLKLIVDSYLNDIKHAIQGAKADVVAYGRYSDPKWFASANAAAKWKGRLSQAIQIELRRRKAERATQGRAATIEFAQIFKRCAKEMLDEETYQIIVDAARQRSDALAGNSIT